PTYYHLLNICAKRIDGDRNAIALFQQSQQDDPPVDSMRRNRYRENPESASATRHQLPSAPLLEVPHASGPALIAAVNQRGESRRAVSRLCHQSAGSSRANASHREPAQSGGLIVL